MYLAPISRTAITAIGSTLALACLFPLMGFAEKSPPAKPRKKAADSSEDQKRRYLAPSDYGQWERLGGQSISPDGYWATYTISRVDEEKTVHLVSLETDDQEDAVVESFKQGERARFSKDSQWLTVFIGKSPDELRKAEKDDDKKKEDGDSSSPGMTVKLRRLKDGETTEIENVTSIQFSADSRFASFELAGSKEKKEENAKALIVRDLITEVDTTFGNVVRHAWSDKGALLALVVDSPSISNSLQLFDPHSGRLRTLDSNEEEYASLSWRENAMDLAAMREMAHEEKEDVSHVLLAWKDLNQANSKHFQYEHSLHESFPDAMYLADGHLEWARSGEAIYVDLKEWENKPKAKDNPTADSTEKPEEPSDEKTDEDPSPKDKAEKEPAKPKKQETTKDDRKKKEAASSKRSKDAAAKESKKPGKGTAKSRKKVRNRKKQHEEEASDADASESGSKDSKKGKSLRETIEKDSNVEVWHAKDVDIMPRQKKQASAKKNPKRRAIWWLEDDSLIQLGNELTERVETLRIDTHAIGSDATPHEREAMFGPRLSDVFIIDTKTGEREQALQAVQYRLKTSPDGRFLLYVDGGNVWSYELENGKKRNLTAAIETNFTNQENDSLVKEKPPYGSGQWLSDSSAVLLYDRYDIWLVAPDGTSHQRLTEGAEKKIRHRIARANFLEEDDNLLDPTRPVYLDVYGDRSKKSGFARLRLQSGNAGAKHRLETLVWEDNHVHSLRRAENNSQVWLYTKEAVDDSPDIFVAGKTLSESRQLSKTNPFQDEFFWGRSELVDYVNDNGVALQGALTYPANYEKGRQYPMIVYIYEKLSQSLHRYSVPSELSAYNRTVFSSEGYFVFQPDIVYRPQEPGVSAVECIVPAVKAVLAKGSVDSDRVGLMGHSWGGYQTAFTVTQTNLFAAGVAGAPLTDMMSMSVQVYWNTGGTNARIFHQSQGRMDTPFWRDVDNFVRNSPIHGIDKLNTPLLVTFGDKDGAVDFGQGVEMYNAARLARKEDFVMLVYPGENHGLKRKENRVDYHYRVRDWMNHYLKGESAPKWITEGKSHLDREKELEEKKKAREDEKKKKQTPSSSDKKEADAKPSSTKKDLEEEGKAAPEREPAVKKGDARKAKRQKARNRKKKARERRRSKKGKKTPSKVSLSTR